MRLLNSIEGVIYASYDRYFQTSDVGLIVGSILAAVHKKLPLSGSIYSSRNGRALSDPVPPETLNDCNLN